MAFIGLLIVNIILFIFAGIIYVFLNLLALGIAFTIKKEKKIAIPFFCIAGTILAIVAIFLIIIFCLVL